MSTRITDQSLSALSPDFRRLLTIQLTTFIDYIDEMAVRTRASKKLALTCMVKESSLIKMHTLNSNLPAA